MLTEFKTLNIILPLFWSTWKWCLDPDSATLHVLAWHVGMIIASVEPHSKVTK